MKTKIYSLLVLAVMVLGFSSCHDEKWTPVSEKCGSVALSSMDVTVDDNATVVDSRAGVDVSGFLVAVYKESGELQDSWSFAAMPEVLTLPVGKYTVAVESHKVEKQGWDCPYYKGSAEFEIFDSRITEIGAVRCTFQSIKVSIRYSDKLRELMGDDTKVTVVCNDEGRLEFTPTETRAGYFAALDGSSTLVATFTSTIKGQPVTVRKEFTDIKAGQHRIITFQVKTGEGVVPDESGVIIVDGEGLKIDGSIATEDRDGNVTVDDDVIGGETRPGGEEFPDDPNIPDNPDDPKPPVSEDVIKMTSEYLSFDSPNIPTDFGEGANPAVVNIYSEAGVQNLKVKISTDNSGFESAVSDLLPMSFDLAYASRDYPNDIDKFKTLGFPMDEDVRGKHDLVFDITEFAPLLAIPIYAGTHVFELTVVDVNNVELTKTLTFDAN